MSRIDRKVKSTYCTELYVEFCTWNIIVRPLQNYELLALLLLVEYFVYGNFYLCKTISI